MVWTVGQLIEKLNKIDNGKELVFVSDIPVTEHPTVCRHDVMVLDTIIDCRNDNSILLKLKIFN